RRRRHHDREHPAAAERDEGHRGGGRSRGRGRGPRCRPALTFAVLIIMTVYAPILTFQRIEGKLFQPMAVTISLAVIGSLVLTLTVIPVLSSLLFRRPPEERESPVLRWPRQVYRAALGWCVGRPFVPILGAAGLLGLALLVFTMLGKE